MVQWQNLPKYSFNAKELDEETGFYYYEARYYKPPVFTSRDPMMEQKPWLSPYHYCSNNPVGRIDPSGCEDDWVERADGTIYWDENATSQATTKDGEKYLGKNVLVATHGRDANLNEAVNGATFDLYLESDHTGPTASIVGNTVPCDVDAYGTLPEGLYNTEYNGLYNGEPSLKILQKEGEPYYDPNRPAGDLPTVKGNPNNSANYYDGKEKKKMKPISDYVMNGILFHIGNYGRASLTTRQGSPISEGCQTGPHGQNTRQIYSDFAKNFVGFHGTYYLRRKKTFNTYKCILK